MGALLPVASRKRVTARCNGTATSTFGGGGGTKLFCSQALNAANANMTKAIRESMAAPCLARPFILSSFGLMQAGECPGFIPAPHFVLRPRRFRRGRRSAFMNSNNPLAVKLETENDAACEIFQSNPFVIHFGLTAASARQR